MKFFKSKYNIAMLIILLIGIVMIGMGSLASILIPIGLDFIAVAMIMEANSIYIANKERKDMDEVDGSKMKFDAKQISVDEDVYVVMEEDKRTLFRQKVKRYNNTMPFCVILTVFAFAMVLITIGLYIGLF